MANHFYGEAYEAHYEKEIKDFTPADWAVSIVYLLIILAAVVFGFCQEWGPMVIMVGAAVCMLHYFLLIVFRANNKVTQLFFLIGLLVMIGGAITCTGSYEVLTLYGFFLYLAVAFGIGIFCLYLAHRKHRKIREYTLSVEAECEIVDVKRINLFRFDDINTSPNNPINDNTLTRPAFHYYVNGQEYYTESEVYYGDMNTGFTEGAKLTLRVNPHNPTDILPKNVGASLEIIMGVSWIVIGAITVIVFVFLLWGRS